jgi:hypothetical protein
VARTADVASSFEGRSMARRTLVSLLVITGVLVAAFASPASARVLINDPFNGSGLLKKPWVQADAKWHRATGAAKVNIPTVNPNQNVGYATVQFRKVYQRIQVSAQLRLSPTRANVGVVLPYVDVENHLFCKIEDTPAHPNGYLAIGRRLHGSQPTILASDFNATVQTSRRYLMVVTRNRRVVTCVLKRGATEMGRLTYHMKPQDVRAFGRGRRAGIRIRLVSRGTRMDEDDGRSSFESFIAQAPIPR